MPRAVIFDLDGCLVDSEPLSLEAVAAQMREIGLSDVTAGEIGARFLGVAITDIAKHAAERLGKPCPQDFAERIEARLLTWYETDLRRIPGARRLLGDLQEAGVGLAIATGGSLRRMGVTLERSELTGFFLGTACSAEEVPRGKPAPDLFELAARRLGVDPSQCLVFEDSPHGVKGAVAAGMTAIGFTGGSHLAGRREAHAKILRAAGAATVIDSLPELAKIVLTDRVQR